MTKVIWAALAALWLWVGASAAQEEPAPEATDDAQIEEAAQRDRADAAPQNEEAEVESQPGAEGDEPSTPDADADVTPAEPGAVPAQAPVADAGAGAIPLSPQLNDPLSAVTPVVCPFRGAVDYEPGDITCGFIDVPENRERPDSRMIRLHFAKIAAKASRLDEDASDKEREEIGAYREDPVAYLTGGPGVGIQSYVSRFKDHDLVKTRDLFILEQRGIEASGDFCPYFGDVDLPTTPIRTTIEREREQAKRMAACFESAKARGVDVTAYNTVENARDVRALRRALGFDQWNVWGISYGSHLGQMLAQVDPEGVKALVLDAIVPNDVGDLMRIHRWIDRVFRNVFDTCEGASACDDLEARFFAAFEALSAERLIVPLEEDPELYPSGEASLGPEILGFAAFSMMYEQDEHPAIPTVTDSLIKLAESGDASILKGFFLGGGDGGFAGFAPGMAAAIRCNDGYVHAQAEIAADDIAEHPSFAGAIFTVEGARLMAETCEAAGLAPRDRADYGLVESDLPTLVINGAWDPVTPPPLAERIAPGFSNGRLIIVPYAGHGPTRSLSECGGAVLTAFFDDPRPQELDATCFEDAVARPDYVDYLQTSATLRFGSMAAEDPKKVLLPGLWAGAPTLILLVTFFVIPFGFFARLIDKRKAVDIKADAADARFTAFATAFAGLLGLLLIGVGAYQAYDISEVSLLAGFAAPAAFGAWIVLFAGLLGLGAVALTVMRAQREALRIGSIIGLVMTGLSGVALALFVLTWDLLPV